ncbi:ribonuclease VapC [Planctomycetales bacterium]|nr:ribonuclease VapC [Planctomycetales bacterium]GHS97026.1 ribonuclease VapC [Planctomycetales bacterium]GHT03816.1 ribonuclease VapC [Planctomycetales bacterium]GHV18897.1 ribonuclease VapC [Planctomycetales bacterium]
MNYLCDTCWVIELLRGDASVREQFRAADGLAVSAITEMELLVGALNKREVLTIKKTLATFTLIEIDESISAAARALIENYAKSHGLCLPDALIAATALNRDLPLITYNGKDFRFIPNLRLLAALP